MFLKNGTECCESIPSLSDRKTNSNFYNSYNLDSGQNKRVNWYFNKGTPLSTAFITQMTQSMSIVCSEPHDVYKCNMSF